MLAILIQNSLALALPETEPPLPLDHDDPKNPTADEKQHCEGGRGGGRGLSENSSFLPTKCASVPTLLSKIVANNWYDSLVTII